MRWLHQGFWLLLTVVPAAFASCSNEDDGSADQNGGDGASDAGSPGHAGKPGIAGSSPQGGDGGAAGGAPAITDGGEPFVGEGGSSGSPSVGEGGQPDVGDGGEASSAAAGQAGAHAAAGAGGEGGAASVEFPPVVLFDAGPHDGLNFGGRLGLDQHCATAQQGLGIPGSATHALISVSASDELRDMPAVYGLPTDRAFVGPTGKKVADDFADLLDGSIDQSLSDAGVSSAQFWITGSNSDGSVRTTCDGWTTNTFAQAVMGSYGYPGSADSSWLTVTGGEVYCSASQYHVICVAYGD